MSVDNLDHKLCYNFKIMGELIKPNPNKTAWSGSEPTATAMAGMLNEVGAGPTGKKVGTNMTCYTDALGHTTVINPTVVLDVFSLSPEGKALRFELGERATLALAMEENRQLMRDSLRRWRAKNNR